MTSESSLAEFRGAAQRFCDAVEGHLVHSEYAFLQQMNLLLPSLYVAAVHVHAEFPDGDNDEDDAATTGHQPWAEVFDTLEAHLVESDRYRKLLWAYPQAGSEETVAEGCLAADLALLYQYLKPKLASPDSDLARAWSKFIWVQGDSLTNAMTAVHEALHDSDLFDGGTDDERSTDNDSPGQTGAT